MACRLHGAGPRSRRTGGWTQSVTPLKAQRVEEVVEGARQRAACSPEYLEDRRVIAGNFEEERIEAIGARREQRWLEAVDVPGKKYRHNRLGRRWQSRVITSCSTQRSLGWYGRVRRSGLGPCSGR